MKLKCFVILICILSGIHGISYAQKIDSTKNNNTHYDDHTMRALFQYDNRKAAAKSLLEKQQEHFDGISNYFEKDGNIKSIHFIWTGETFTYTGQINESDYEQLRNKLDHISRDSDFFNWGIRVSYYRGVINNKIRVTIYDAIMPKEFNGFWCSEYFIYDKDGLPEKKENNPKIATWQIEERINPNWYLKQNISKISYANNNYIRLGDRKKKIRVKNWSKESNLVSFKRVKKIISKNSNKFNEFAKILNEKDAYFHYYCYLDYKHAADGKRYKNLNEFSFHNKEARKNLMDENPNKKRCVVYCKKAENFIRLLEENHLVLSAGISIGCEDLDNGKSSMKIFTRTKAQDGQCLNVTITYDETGAPKEKDKSMKMLMPNWYYKSEIGEIQGLKAAE